MRSGDGDSSIILRLCSVVLFFSLALNAREYLVSYRYVVKDAILYNEVLQISEAMTKCNGKVTNNYLIFPTNEKNDIKVIISKNRDEFIEFIHKLGMLVEHKSININNQNSSTTIMTLKTTCFKVDFNDTFVKIAPLKQR